MTVETTMIRFSPPKEIDDFTTETQKKQWTESVASIFDWAKKGREFTWCEGKTYQILNNSPRDQFYHPVDINKLNEVVEHTITWRAFPRELLRQFSTTKMQWIFVDSSRKRQSGFCEWSVSRNQEGKITKVTFTCESPEYWNFLGKTHPEKVLELYKTHVNKDVVKEDLFDQNGNYILNNQWNKDTENGAMHLINPINALKSLVELVSSATIVRENSGNVIKDPGHLIDASQLGVKERISDREIAKEVNKLAREGKLITLKDPIGVYFHRFLPDGWEMPGNSDPQNYWKITRGEDAPVRAVFEIPEERGFTVGDIKIGGEPITTGAQIAEFVEMKLKIQSINSAQLNIKKFEKIDYILANILDEKVKESSENQRKEEDGLLQSSKRVALRYDPFRV